MLLFPQQVIIQLLQIVLGEKLRIIYSFHRAAKSLILEYGGGENLTLGVVSSSNTDLGSEIGKYVVSLIGSGAFNLNTHP